MLRSMSSVQALVGAGLYPAPRWFPQSMDPTRQWVRMMLFTEEDYRRAPFLDARGLRDGMVQGAVAWRQLADLSQPDHRCDAHWMFHISHVGSTLLSRLLGECGNALCLREPLILRTLVDGARSETNERLPVMRRLFSRCFRESQHAIVKATSSLSELAAPLLGPANHGGKALFISTSPRNFIVGRLSRDQSELAQRAPERIARLKRRLPKLDPTKATATKARLAAMTWACEASSMEAAMERIEADRWLLLNFSTFLEDAAANLANVARHFDLAVDSTQVDAIVNGPLMRRNAKGNSPLAMTTERRLDEEETSVRERASISDALGWLEGLRASSGLVDRACARFE